MEIESLVLSKRPSSVPIYRQIVSDFERLIRNGKLVPGAKLPSEAELQERYGVSRTPVRKALGILELNGLIFRAQGRGSFVSDESFRGAIREIETGRSWRLGEKEPTNLTLSIEEIRCDHDLALEAGFIENDRLIKLRRLFLIAGSPKVYTIHYLRPFITVEKLRSEGNFPNLYELLQELGFEPFDVTISITAKMLDPKEVEVFKVAPPSVALVIKQTYLGLNGQKTWYLKSFVLADGYEYHIQSRRN